MKAPLILITLITIATAPTNLFSALQDPKHPTLGRVTVTLSQQPQIISKTEQIKQNISDHPYKATIGSIAAAHALHSLISLSKDKNSVDQLQCQINLGAAVVLALYCLQPIFWNSATEKQEQNNNQH